MELSTPALIELISRSGMLSLQNILYLQGEKQTPRGETVDLIITAVFPETGEVEVSQGNNGKLPRNKLQHGIWADAVWFPSPPLENAINAVRHMDAKRQPIDAKALQAKIDAERARNEEERNSTAYKILCDNALSQALTTIATPSENVQHWHLVLLAMARCSDLILRNEREIEFFTNRVDQAREYGAGLWSKPKQITWQTDILRRSADQLQKHLGN